MEYRQARIEDNLRLRARIIRALRRFFIDSGYLEVETPIRIPAPVPEDHIDLQPSGDAYLHSSPEGCMKRLLAAGYDRIFQVCKSFRAGERGNRHLSELTLLEWYTVNSDYHDMMAQCEDLVRFAARAVVGQDAIEYGGQRIDLKPPWPKITVTEAFSQFAGLSAEAALDSDRFEELLTTRIEPGLKRTTPVFLYDYPLRCGALARSRADHPAVAERFELYIGGLELCNGFSELTDPNEQRRRFEQVGRFRSARGKPVYPMPGRFLNALADMPEAAGTALGVDRLAMLFADTDCIDEVVAFTPEEL